MGKFKLLGELPAGDWQFCLVCVKGEADVIVMLDKTGQYRPRIIVNGEVKLLEAA